MSTPSTLEQLRAILRRDTGTDDASRALAAEAGLPIAHGRIDWTSLPTFGGVAPTDTDGVWSWDASRLLVDDGANGLEIVPRDGRAEDACGGRGGS